MKKEIDLSGSRIVIGIPCYNDIPVQLIQALLETQAELRQYGVHCAFFFKPGCSLLDKARNEILMAFLRDAEATHLLCVDADVIFTPTDVLKLLAHSLNNPDRILAGAYPVKTIERDFRYPLVLDEHNYVVSDTNGLIQVQHTPAGFMMINRESLTKMIELLPDESFYSDDKGEFADVRMPCLFESGVVDNAYVGEDVRFCRHAERADVTTWLDPSINLIHRGFYNYQHDFIAWARETYDIIESKR